MTDFLAAAGKHSNDAIRECLQKYHVADQDFQRARTTIISCFNMEKPETHEVAFNWLAKVVRECNEQKEKKSMDPERFAIETTFNHLI